MRDSYNLGEWKPSKQWLDLQLRVAKRLKKAGITSKDMDKVIDNLRRAKTKKKRKTLP